MLLEAPNKHQMMTRYVCTGDADSSILLALVSSVPYGHYIKKLECTNYAVKCYCTTLENLTNDKPSYK